MKNLLNIGIACILILVAQVSEAETKKLPLKLKGNVFSPYSIEYSADGEKVCIAGNDSDESGSSTGRLIMIDRVRNVVMWQREIPVPDGYGGLFPLQCKVADDRVYMLADVDAKSPDAVSQTLTYIYSFDFSGKEAANRKLKNSAGSQYGYAIDAGAGGVKVAGYSMIEDGRFEYYSTYTTLLDKNLEPRGQPLIRKNGAYSDFIGARIVGDDLFVAGTFSEAKVDKKKRITDFSGSRLRLAAGYVWSTHTSFNPHAGIATGVGADGTIYSLGFEKTSSALLTIAPGGKISPLLLYSSPYCQTRSLTEYRGKLISVRKGCDDNQNALLEIDPLSGRETVLHWIEDEPVMAATHGVSWSVMAENKSGDVYFYSSDVGGN